jgi:hypothetical protein
MPLDEKISNNIIKLASAWEKTQELSSKIESKLTEYKIDLGNVNLSVLDNFPITLTNDKIERSKVLNYLKSTIQTIEHDKKIITDLYQTFSSNQQYVNEFGMIAVSQLLTNLINLDKELVKMSKIVTDLLVTWETIDYNKELGQEPMDEHSLVSGNSPFSGNVRMDDEGSTEKE